MRAGDARLLPGRAGRGLRLSRDASSPSASGHPRRPRPTRASSQTPPRALQARQEAAHRRRRRRALFRGREPSCSPSARSAGIPVGETQAGKSRDRLVDHPLQPRRDRRHRAPAPPMRLAAEADVVLGGRHAAAGLHHRLLGAVQEPEPPLHRRSTRSPSMPPSTARCRWSPTRAAALAALDAALGDWQRAGGLDGDRGQGEALNGTRSPRATPRRPTRELPSDAQVHRRACMRAGDEPTTSWSAPPAACRASCTSSGRPARAARLPHGIRLFLHGLRDRRRRSA